MAADATAKLLPRALAAWKKEVDVSLDPRKLRPGELVQLLNSSPLGPIVRARDLTRHRDQGGLRIGDGKTVDFFRYAAWLCDLKHRPEAPRSTKAEAMA